MFSHVDESGIALLDISGDWQRWLSIKSSDLCLKTVLEFISTEKMEFTTININ
jgi:hypothetical protein